MSTVKADNFADRNGDNSIPQSYLFGGVAKSRIRYPNGAASISDSMNISSLTDSSTGNAIANLTSAMGSASYEAFATADEYHTAVTVSSASAYNIRSYNSSHAAADAAASGMNLGDLA